MAAQLEIAGRRLERSLVRNDTQEVKLMFSGKRMQDSIESLPVTGPRGPWVLVGHDQHRHGRCRAASAAPCRYTR
jgi:hypothetical protein